MLLLGGGLTSVKLERCRRRGRDLARIDRILRARSTILPRISASP
jgi:hypothetical protein